MANETRSDDKAFDVPKKEAMHLVGKSEKTLQRWVKDGLIGVEYRPGPYGDEAYYNRDDLLKMRHGKPRQDNDGGPMRHADLALIAKEAEWTHNQLTQTLSTLSEELPAFRQELKEAKDETIKAVREQGNLQKQIGKLEQSESQLKENQKQLQTKFQDLERQYEEASRYKKYFRSVVVWSVAAILLVFLVSVAFAPQLEGLRETIFSIFK